jgi:hypothetical protein
MEYIEKIKELCNEVERVFPAQITIDYFEEFENQFFDDSRNLTENPIERDELGAKQYEISILLDVMDQQKFAVDVDIFKRMYNQIGEWAKAVEARNVLLGIPKHKG